MFPTSSRLNAAKTEMLFGKLSSALPGFLKPPQNALEGWHKALNKLGIAMPSEFSAAVWSWEVVCS